jgi:hypothetical protein
MSLEQCGFCVSGRRRLLSMTHATEGRDVRSALLVKLFLRIACKAFLFEFPAKNKAQDTSLWTISDLWRTGGAARLFGRGKACLN